MTKDEILAGESETLEFKRDIPEQSIKYMKTVVAFANGKGGTIVFGVDDKTRKVVGIKKAEVFQKADAIADAIFNSCDPKIRPNINLHIVSTVLIRQSLCEHHYQLRIGTKDLHHLIVHN